MKQSLSVFIILVLSSLAVVVLAQSTNGSEGIWQPPPGTTWQWQLSGAVDTRYDVDMYDIDLFDTPQSTIDTLRARGVIVICYFSAGSYENWRPDAGQFPAHIIGNKLDGWAGERWLNIADVSALADVMQARLELAVAKGCDGVEPDNVDGYTNNTGFSLTYVDQIRYAAWMVEQAHTLGLSIGLKNNLDQVVDLEPFYDWALNEQCFQYEECELLLPFVQSGKAVFGVEYELKPNKYCNMAISYEFSWLHKTYDLGNEAPGSCAGDAPTITATLVPTNEPVFTPEPTNVPVITSVPTNVSVTIVPTNEPVTPEPTDDPDEYDSEGYDDDGYDRKGYDKKGYDRDGYDRKGYDKQGYDEDGYDRKGYDSEGYDRSGYDDEGYDEKGYDRKGYDRDGYDKKGYDRQGYDEDGCTKDSCD